MFVVNQIGHETRGVIVNKPALQAWLQAWTTGVSFHSPVHPAPDPQKVEPLDVATLRRLRVKTAKS
jgi:hypothetical protein